MGKVIKCPECGKLLAVRFPVHDCKAEDRPFTVIAIYADDDTRYAECVMAADPEAAEAAVREAAPAEIIVAGVIAGHVTLVG